MKYSIDFSTMHRPRSPNQSVSRLSVPSETWQIGNDRIRLHHKWVDIQLHTPHQFSHWSNDDDDIFISSITDYTSSSAHGQVYSITADGDLPFMGMNTEACQHTVCPINQSSRQTYTYTLNVAKKFPAVTIIIPFLFPYYLSFSPKLNSFVSSCRERMKSNGCCVIQINQIRPPNSAVSSLAFDSYDKFHKRTHRTDWFTSINQFSIHFFTFFFLFLYTKQNSKRNTRRTGNAKKNP